MTDVTLSTVAAKKAEILTAHEKASWTVLARQYPGVKRGTLQRFATTDYEPHRPEVRAALGLPVLLPAPVCPVHGVVHAHQHRLVPAWVTQAADWLRERERR